MYIKKIFFILDFEGILRPVNTDFSTFVAKFIKENDWILCFSIRLNQFGWINYYCFGE